MVSIDTIIVSLPQQSFNDALSCYEKIKNLDKNKDYFTYLKYCTWGIISANICMESYLTEYIQCRCKELGMPDPFKGKKVDFPNKIKFLQKKLKSKIQSYNSTNFKRIRKARDSRKSILHYIGDVFFEINEQNTIESIDACRDLVSFILKGDGKNPQTQASWVFQTKSKVIK